MRQAALDRHRRAQCVTIDMSNDIAAQEGMVCGGQKKVLLADLGTKNRHKVKKKLSKNTGIKCHILSGIHRFRMV